MSVAVDSGNTGRHPRVSFGRVVDALTAASGPGRSSGGWVKFRCPVANHGDGSGDRTPSLGVRYDAAKSRTRVECFTGCDDTAVLAAAGLTIADLFDDPPPKTGRKRSAGSSNGLVDLDQRRQPAPRRAAKPSSPEDPGKKRKSDLGQVVAQYEYQSADGQRIGRVLRYEPKDFRPQRWNPDTRRWTVGGFPPTLYRLPQVTAAIGAGEPVYLVEGEKDADTANRYGVVGTTNASGGGRGKFLAEHAEQLRGAHVVVVADRDKAGYEHALEALERLQGVAASTRVVRAATGKDLTDHADGGLDIDGLEAIDPAAELAALTGEPPPQTEESGRSAGGPPPPTGGGGGSRSDDDGVPNQLPRYLHRHGETVRVNGTADKPTFATVWRCEVSVTAEIVNDNGDPNADPLSGGWQLKLRRRRLDLAGAPVRDDAGELVHDEAHIVLPADKIRDGSWPELLPWAGLIHDFTPAGKSRALSAATLVQAFPAEMLRRYTSTGWRTLPDGRDMFVHAGGGITAAGPIPLDEVAVTGKLRVFDMPAPTQDPVELKMAVLEGFLPLLDLPAAVVAPLIGFAFRGIFGSPRASIHLVGDPGSGKTG
ncbi:MAG: hypothetical protein ACXWZL_07595, partial [Mycobacterium sp.]